MESSESPPGKNRRQISVPTATAIVIANMVGTGIFTSLGFQLAGIRSGFSILLLWAIGGVISLCGAMSYGELISRLPRSGGEYHFISRIYHPALGFMAGWVGMICGFCTPVALACLAFGRYLATATGTGHPLLLSAAIAVTITGVHLLGVGVGAIFQNIFTTLKLTILLGLTIAAFVIGSRQDASFLPQAGDLHMIFSEPFAIGLIYVMYAYSGWNGATYMAGEVRNARFNVPLALLLGTGAVMVCYLLVNSSFLYSTPENLLKGQMEIGLIVGKQLFGTAGGNLVGGLIATGLISAISAMVWAGSRVSMTIGEDFRILHFLSRRSKSGTPAVSLLLQLLVVLFVIFNAKFEDILLYTQFSLLVCLFLTVLGVFVLRHRFGPNTSGVQAWGYPFTPALFLIMAGFMIVHLFIQKPVTSVLGVGGMGLGLILYFCEPAEHRRALASRRFEE